jgi:hypothetical protein
VPPANPSRRRREGTTLMRRECTRERSALPDRNVSAAAA